MNGPLLDLRRATARSWALAQRFAAGSIRRVALISCLQVGFQMAAVGSVFPFLTLATSPEPNLTVPGELLQNWFPQWDSSEATLFLGLLVLVLQLLAAGCGFAGDYSRARFAHFTAHNLAVRLMQGIAQRPYLDYVRGNTSRDLKRLRDDVNIFLTEVLLPMLDAGVRLVGAGLMAGVLFLANPWVALFTAMGFGLAYVGVLASLRGILARANRERNQSVQKQLLAASELLQHYKILLVHGAREVFTNRFQHASQNLAATEAPVSVIRATPRLLMEAIAFSTLILLILWGLAHPHRAPDLIPIAGTYALAGYRLLPSLSLVYSQIVSVLTRQAVVDDLLSELERSSGEPSLPSSPPERLPFPEVIRFQSVSFQFPDQEEPVLNQLDLTLARNRRIALVGASGSGKSTLLDLLLGLLKPDEGQILLDDTPLQDVDLDQWRAGIGYVPQETVLLDASLRDNILFGLPNEDSRLEEVLDLARLQSWVSSDLPLGLDSAMGERGSQVSGGQRQRIALARALYRAPSLLILDEATSALDQETERSILQSLGRLPRSLTTIMVSHRPAPVRDADVIFYLEKGTIVASGSCEELCASHPAFQSLMSATA